ncbi:MAG: R2-like ligand-binding oxidase [Deltaproteobacteria bacterium]|nr:R2-like ligand-binding oxidase [Deltaproteobacteria bacterium]
MHNLFSASWIEVLTRRLAEDETYRRDAARWEGDLILTLSGEGEQAPGAYLDLWHGQCRAGRVAQEKDYLQARYVIQGPAGVWQQLFQGSLGPLAALASRKLRLERGSLFQLLPHAKAAEALVQVSRGISTLFPGSQPDSSTSASQDEPPERHFSITDPKGIDWQSPPMRLWAKAKRDGIWNPELIDLETDRQQWQELDAGEQDLLLRLAALFGAGEESVVTDLMPLMAVIAAEGRLEEEMFLTSFLWEEAKHVEAFRRFFDTVAEERGDLTRYHSPSFRRIFYQELPEAMGRLNSDSSPVAQARASTSYNLIVEGVLAETGYFAYGEILKSRGILPGMQKVIAYLRADESRHLAYGVFLLCRLVAEHGDPVWEAIEERMEALLEPALGVVREAFAAYDPKTVPFDLTVEPFLEFALSQFQKRLARISSSRYRSLEEVLQVG